MKQLTNILKDLGMDYTICVECKYANYENLLLLVYKV